MRRAWIVATMVSAASAAAQPATTPPSPAPTGVPPGYPPPRSRTLFPPGHVPLSPATTPPAEEPVPIVSLELFGAIGPQNSRIGLAIDASIVSQLAVGLGIAEAGGDGWSGTQLSASVRGRFPISRRHRSFGVGITLARGSYAYAPLIGEYALKTWTRAYMYRVQATTESTGRFHTRWFLEYGGVLNKDDYSCPEFEFCDGSSGFIFGGGVALGFGVL